MNNDHSQLTIDLLNELFAAWLRAMTYPEIRASRARIRVLHKARDQLVGRNAEIPETLKSQYHGVFLRDIFVSKYPADAE
ncbi:MAG: hypothetical protein ACK4ZW_11755 [Blastomonas sp.]